MHKETSEQSDADQTNGGSTRPWIALVAVVAVLDQITKWAIVLSFHERERLPIIDGLFDLTLLYNPGSAFSFLASSGGWQRWLFTVIGFAATALLYTLLRQSLHQKWFAFGISMIMGGAIGNVIDRLTHGKVVDFLLAYWDGHYFPAFNVADSAITIGAVCLIADEIIRWRNARKLSTPQE